jgi:hypothetical protein
VSNYLWDVIAGTGLLLFAGGLWWLCPPLALIVVGLLTALFGFWGARLWAKGRGTTDVD